MRKFLAVALVALLAGCGYSCPAQADGLQVRFTGQPADLTSLATDDTVALWDMSTDNAGALLDHSGSNIVVQSENFSTGWSVTYASVSDNQVANPIDGAVTADAILEDGTAAQLHRIYQGAVAMTAEKTYATSVYAKASGRTWIYLYNDHTANGVYFDIENGVLGTQTGGGVRGKIQKLPDGWFRCTIIWNASSTGTHTHFVYIAEADNDITFDGASQSSVYLWGAQVQEVRGDPNVVGEYVRTSTTKRPWRDLGPTPDYAPDCDSYVFDTIGASDCTSEDGVAITTVSATPPKLIRLDPSSNNDFLVAPAANTCDITYQGLVSPAAQDNYIQRAEFNSWGAAKDGDCTAGATTWVDVCDEGNGTSDIDEETTIQADGNSSVKMTLTGTTSFAEMRSAACVTDLVGDNLHVGVWGQGTGANEINVGAYEYTGTDCTGYIGSIQAVTGYDVGTTWEYIGGNIESTDWDGSANSWIFYVKEYGDGGVTSYFDSPVAIDWNGNKMPPAAFCTNDATQTASCSSYVHNHAQDATEGPWKFWWTGKTTWDVTTCTTPNNYAYCMPGSPTDNVWSIQLDITLDAMRCTVHGEGEPEPAMNWNYSDAGVGWAADTSYEVYCAYWPWYTNLAAQDFKIDGVTYHNHGGYASTGTLPGGLMSDSQTVIWFGSQGSTGYNVIAEKLTWCHSGMPAPVTWNVPVDGHGRRKSPRYNRTESYYSLAHAAWMNMFDESHTLTFQVIHNEDTDDRTIFSHGLKGTDGLVVELTETSARAVYSKSGSSVNVELTGINTDDDVHHTLHVIRDSGVARICWDGTCSSHVNVAGHGVDGSRTLYLGAGNTPYPDNIHSGAILFAHVEDAAKGIGYVKGTHDTLAGYPSTVGTKAGGGFDFSRGDVSWAHLSDGTLVEVGEDQAKIGEGILLEFGSTNYMTYSNDPTNGVWTETRMDYVLDSERTTPFKRNDTPYAGLTSWYLHEDTTPAQTHAVSHSTVTDSTDPHVLSGIFKAVNREWVALYTASGPVAYVYFNLRNGTIGTQTSATGAIKHLGDGWYRCEMRYTPTSAAQQHAVYIGEADNDSYFDGLDQDSLLMAHLQYERGTFATTPIETVAGADVRNADALTFDPYQAGADPSFPVVFDGAGSQATELTVEFKTRCLFDGTADIGAQRFYFTFGNAASANSRFESYVSATGRIYYQVVDDAGGVTNAYSAVDPVDFTEWHVVKFYIDFADLSRNRLWINGSSAGMIHAGNSGTAALDGTGNTFKFGANRASTVSGACEMEYFRAVPRRF